MRFILILVSFLMLSCSQGFKGDTSKLNGYWEIQKVVKDDQIIKEYQVNSMVDYFTLKDDSSGLRKKLAPKLNGGFASTRNTDEFSIRQEGDQVFLDYKTPYDSWTDEIIAVNDNLLITQNADGVQYWYQKFSPKDIFPDE